MSSRAASPTILGAEFLGSVYDLESLPPEGLAADVPEVAFAGRSNVGKSSLINQLIGRRGLARVSATPGRTRSLNFLRVVVAAGSQRPRGAGAAGGVAGAARGRELRFVDLPGYGYAAVSHEARRSWAPLVEGYLERRRTLRAVVLILDPRRGPEEEEIDLCEWLAARRRPLLAVLTKADKVSQAERARALAETRARLPLAASPIAFSAPTGEGREALWWATLDRCWPRR